MNGDTAPPLEVDGSIEAFLCSNPLALGQSMLLHYCKSVACISWFSSGCVWLLFNSRMVKPKIDIGTKLFSTFFSPVLVAVFRQIADLVPVVRSPEQVDMLPSPHPFCPTVGTDPPVPHESNDNQINSPMPKYRQSFVILPVLHPASLLSTACSRNENIEVELIHQLSIICAYYQPEKTDRILSGTCWCFCFS